MVVEGRSSDLAFLCLGFIPFMPNVILLPKSSIKIRICCLNSFSCNFLKMKNNCSYSSSFGSIVLLLSSAALFLHALINQSKQAHITIYDMTQIWIFINKPLCNISDFVECIDSPPAWTWCKSVGSFHSSCFIVVQCQRYTHNNNAIVK